MWVINGFFVFLPSLNVLEQNMVVGGWTAFTGGTIFEIGSYLMVLEALNRRHEVTIPERSCIDGDRYVLGTLFNAHSQEQLLDVLMISIIDRGAIPPRRDLKRTINNNGYGLVHDGTKLDL